MRSQPIYLDYNATTPVDPEVVEAMLPYLHGRYGNPSSAHPYGREARSAVEEARGHVAALLRAEPGEIVFTSGGSESNNTVIQGIARRRNRKGRHFITSAIEHPAVTEPLAALSAEGFRVTKLSVDDRGRVSPESLRRALTPDTILISVMHANNEVGTVQPIAELAAIARTARVPFHTDAAQSIGKTPVRVAELGVDFLSVAGHKMYAPKGVGALYIRGGSDLPRLIHGAGHEKGRRAGTENVLGIVGLGKAAERAAQMLDLEGARYRELRDRLWARLSASLDEIRWNGDPDGGLPNTLSVSFRGVDATVLLSDVADRVSASAGAACHSDTILVSKVLQALRVPFEDARGTVRLSVGRMTTSEEIDEAATILVEAVTRLRRTGFAS